MSYSAPGSVVEQIWEQISKSRVLLADLTDKNPNVFYELGLAHAANKPVVFTSARIEDVPFDLRHLRVIVYETRDPEWASKLRKLITDYLRNTLRDPAKSIPHPFRVAAGIPLGESVADLDAGRCQRVQEKVRLTLFRLVIAPHPDQRVGERLAEDFAVAVAGGTAEDEAIIVAFRPQARPRSASTQFCYVEIQKFSRYFLPKT